MMKNPSRKLSKAFDLIAVIQIHVGIGQSVRGGGQVSEARRAGKQMEQSKARSAW